MGITATGSLATPDWVLDSKFYGNIEREAKALPFSKETATRTALFQCKWGPILGDVDYPTKESPITIQVRPGETKQQTEERFAAAAYAELSRILANNKMLGCHGHRFVQFLPTAKEALKVPSKGENNTKPPVTDKCDGEWATRPVCYK